MIPFLLRRPFSFAATVCFLVWLAVVAADVAFVHAPPLLQHGKIGWTSAMRDHSLTRLPTNRLRPITSRCSLPTATIRTSSKRHSFACTRLYWSLFPSSSDNKSSKSSSQSLPSSFQQRPGESNMDFLRRLQATSFSNSSELGEYDAFDEQGEMEPKQPRGSYQRVEDWDAEQRKNGSLSWEERVQFDGQRFGNQVQQDAILRRHLNSF